VLTDVQYEGERIDPAAFIDDYDEQSFFLCRVAAPSKVLAKFARYKGVKDHCGTGESKPTLDEMYTHGYRIAAIRYQAFIDLEIPVKPHSDGNDFRPDGHVNMIDAKSHATPLSRSARLLNHEETLAG
jgi:hypothetical protein